MEKKLSMNLRDLQLQLGPWTEHNFGPRPSWQPLLGVQEEVGELAHAHLKAAQGIRGTPAEHAAAKFDAVGDILIFLADYCNRESIDMQQALEDTWAQVSKRDWKKNQLTGL
jgi:NTP pyrophosphatase (non-canonical NTP hydrolase)